VVEEVEVDVGGELADGEVGGRGLVGLLEFPVGVEGDGDVWGGHDGWWVGLVCV